MEHPFLAPETAGHLQRTGKGHDQLFVAPVAMSFAAVAPWNVVNPVATLDLEGYVAGMSGSGGIPHCLLDYRKIASGIEKATQCHHPWLIIIICLHQEQNYKKLSTCPNIGLNLPTLNKSKN